MAEKIEYFEGLRGIAAFSVYVGHFCPLFIVSISFLVTLVSALFFFGRTFCVCIFFVLSGYVLTNAFFRTKENEFLVSGAVRRYIRLLIPVSFLLLIIFLFVYPGLKGSWNPTEIVNAFSLMFWGVFVEGQYTIAPASFGSYTAVLWTMTIEFIGSFIVFSFAALFGKLQNRWFFYIVSFVMFLHTFYLAFILGMSLADLNSNVSSGNFLKIQNRFVVILIFVLGLFIGSYPAIPVFGPAYTGTVGITDFIFYISQDLDPFGSLTTGSLSSLGFIYILGAGLIMVALINSRVLQRLLSGRVPVFLGKISFSLYLIHMLIINTFSYFVLDKIFGYNLTFVSGVCVFLLTTTVLFCTSYLMYLWIDRPGTAFSKWVYIRFFQKSASK